mmetsp:Transcript_60211/g.141800  ORF Transcript_60211/g.141800 Transcript_60211/m.141800 type:complete len:124 (-) Transcript_60211:216-587(-)
MCPVEGKRVDVGHIVHLEALVQWLHVVWVVGARDVHIIRMLPGVDQCHPSCAGPKFQHPPLHHPPLHELEQPVSAGQTRSEQCVLSVLLGSLMPDLTSCLSFCSFSLRSAAASDPADIRRLKQ